MSAGQIFRKLLKYPHAAVFDPSPADVLAIRVRNDAGLAWSVADDVLTITSGGDEHAYQLTGKSLGQLVAELGLDGHHVVYQNPELLGLGAEVLVPGSGDQDASNGDHLYGFTSLLWMLLRAYSIELAAAEYQSAQAIRQMAIPQSEGEWLDFWGVLYGYPRLQGESDASMRVRLGQEVFALRVNGFAIEARIKDATGKAVEIFEPWKKILEHDQCQWDDDLYLEGGDYYCFFVIHPIAREAVDFDDVMPVVHRNRAAGIVVHPPMVILPTQHVTADDAEVIAHFCHRNSNGGAVTEDMLRWDFAAIDQDAEELVGDLMHHQARRYQSGVVHTSRYWDDLPWAAFDWEETPIAGLHHETISTLS